ncbi:MAG: hypothetical protein NT000_04920 [Proteobacteria bacterium]|nr:hypothetical protein [Pseudomonadota bacterium]
MFLLLGLRPSFAEEGLDSTAPLLFNQSLTLSLSSNPIEQKAGDILFQTYVQKYGGDAASSAYIFSPLTQKWIEAKGLSSKQLSQKIEKKDWIGVQEFVQSQRESEPVDEEQENEAAKKLAEALNGGLASFSPQSIRGFEVATPNKSPVPEVVEEKNSIENNRGEKKQSLVATDVNSDEIKTELVLDSDLISSKKTKPGAPSSNKKKKFEKQIENTAEVSNLFMGVERQLLEDLGIRKLAKGISIFSFSRFHLKNSFPLAKANHSQQN